MYRFGSCTHAMVVQLKTNQYSDAKVKFHPNFLFDIGGEREWIEGDLCTKKKAGKLAGSMGWACKQKRGGYQRLRCSLTLAIKEQCICWALAGMLFFLCLAAVPLGLPPSPSGMPFPLTSILTDSRLWLIIAGMTGTEAFHRAIIQPLENTDENSGF